MPSPSAPPPPFQVATEDLGRAVVVRVRGEVDVATAPRMQAAIEPQLANGRQVVLDMADVAFIDLHGLAVMLRASRQAQREEGGFALARPSWCVVRLLDLVHVDGELTILPDGADPLEAA